MSKDLDYFKDFLANPASFKVHEFYSMLREWAEYVGAHKNDFNYLKDKKWRKIRERLIAAVRIKDKFGKEFDILIAKLEAAFEKGANADKITAFKEWLEFLKRNQAEYNIPDNDIEESEEDLKKLINFFRSCEIIGKKPDKNDINIQKALENLENSMFEHYERTGKRPILSALQIKQSKKGN